MRAVLWGTYDLGKPRVRILLRGLRVNGISVHECHIDIWKGVEDKSQLSGFLPYIYKLGYILVSYPRLIWRYLKAPKHDAILVPYMGHLDILILWPFAKLRGAKIVWDAFLSLYNTIVEDRQIIGPRNPLAWLIYALEWLATRAADIVILDTASHADYFANRYNLKSDKLDFVFVGVEPNRFPTLPPLELKEPNEPLIVLFYGQFIPLHGIPTIIEAARQLDDGSVRWVLIGKGQEENVIRASLKQEPIKNLEWHPWVAYEDLIDWIRRADVCLGIFSASEKAGRVIPNKVFQIVSAGRPLITRESTAINELFPSDELGVVLVSPEDPNALACALKKFIADYEKLVATKLYFNQQQMINPHSIGSRVARILMTVRKK
jgi:glycosyltransferase involved in cell wall biosynthesis